MPTYNHSNVMSQLNITYPNTLIRCLLMAQLDLCYGSSYFKPFYLIIWEDLRNNLSYNEVSIFQV